MRVLPFALVALTQLAVSCHTIGVEISPEQVEQSIGMTEEELEELYGVPHFSSVDSEGIETIGYGLEHRYGTGLDATTIVEFTLEGGRVTKSKRSFSRPIANKNRARR